MDNLYIVGGTPLKGDCELSTAKNALLPILAGCVLCNGVIKLNRVVYYSDVNNMLKILENLGAKIIKSQDSVIIEASLISKYFLSEFYTKTVRSSIFMLGPMLARLKKVKIAYPGGCNIGNRPIDLHLKGLKYLNVKIEEKFGYIYCDGKNMRAGAVHLDFPSVGATENLIMASVFLRGTTTIYNTAREPEIEDLQNFINSMGGKVKGAGSSIITIEGVNALRNTEYQPISDRIVTGTYLIACAMAGGEITLHNAIKEHNFPLINKLNQAGCKIKCNKNDISISVKGRCKSIARIDTQPYPGFATDLQNQMLALQTISKGTSLITENLYETRYKIVNELMKMGADVTIKDRMAIINGVNRLYGANVEAMDLRGGAGLVLAGLNAEGYTTIVGVEHIDRGYFHIEKDLKRLGANIERKKID